MANSNALPKIAILILAAGESKRMGVSKQLLKWGNTTLLNHSIEQATNSKAETVFIILGANYEKIKESIQNESVTILRNKDWQTGMASSIVFGITHLQNLGYEGALIMLIDQPQVDTTFLNRLMLEFQKVEQPIIATTYTKSIGVPAVFAKSYFKKLALLKGEKGGKQLINEKRSNTFALTPSNKIMDIDTMEAYEKLYALSFGSK